MTAAEFVNLLEERNLVPLPVLTALQRQIQQAAPRSIPAANVAKALVEKGLLSELLVQQLLDELQLRSPGNATIVAAGSKTAPRPLAKSAPRKATAGDDDDLGLVPYEEKGKHSTDQAASVPDPKKTPSPGSASRDNMSPLLKAAPIPKGSPVPVAKPVSTVAKPVASATGQTGTAKSPPVATLTKQAPAAPKTPNDEDQFGLSSSTGGIDDLYGDSAAVVDLGGGLSTSAPHAASADLLGGAPLADPVIGPRRAAAKTPLWIWIGGAAVVLLAIGGGALLFLGGDKDAAWKRVEQLYSQKDPAAAAQLLEFAKNHPVHPQAGTAEVYAAMLELEDLGKQKLSPRDKARALVERVSPLVAEPALDKAHLMLSKLIPEQLEVVVKLAAADDKQSPERRAEFIRLADELLTLAEDPRVIPYASRNWRRGDALQEQVAQLTRGAARAQTWEAAKQEIPSLLSAGKTAIARYKMREFLSLYPEFALAPEWKFWSQQAP